jgi:hypothetical protein
MRQAVIFAAVLVAAAPAGAHVGAVVSNAQFTSPAGPATTTSDGGVVLGDPQYAFPTADQSFTISWSDGDNDPTGRFFFWYWDHEPTFGVLPDDIEANAKIITEVGQPVGQQVAIFAGCTCADDQGVTCADLSGGAMRDCRNSFQWDTSQIAAGAYWIIAVNSDPPFHVYSVAPAPVVVSHGGTPPPPAALVLRPDGFGSWDQSYRIQWLAKGTPPLRFDVAYGDEMNALAAPTPIGTNVTPIVNADGTYALDWDISGLMSLGNYFVRVTVTDGNGKTAFTDSKFGLSVFHPGAQQPDMAMSLDGGGVGDPPKKGCDVGAGAGASTVPFALVVLALLAAARLSRKQG